MKAISTFRMFRSFLLVTSLLLSFAPEAQTVRVRLFEGSSGTEARFTPTDSPLRVRVDGADVGQVLPGEVVHVERESNGIRVALEGIRTSGDHVELLGGGLTRLRAKKYDRTYVGDFHIRNGSRSLSIVNHAPIEPYVASVVATEYPFKRIEGVKAQAVLARTYALRHAGDHTHWDVEDSQRSQVYRGDGAATETTRQASAETTGQVLMYGSEIVEAVYSSSSGGHTANNEAIWGTDPVPYLRGRPDPWDQEAPDHRWTTSADATSVHRAVSRYASGTNGITVSERSPSGRIRRVTLHPSGKTISGSQFRSAVSSAIGWRTMKSTYVDISESGGRYTFSGRGFGHGVGMSQYGARGQARAGRTYDEILSFYFAGTHLTSGGETGVLVAGTGSSEPRPEGLRRSPTRRSVAWGLEAAPEDSRVAPDAPPAYTAAPVGIQDTATPVVTPRAAPRVDTRPAWVVREALPNSESVRSRPTRRATAREDAASDSSATPRTGWEPN